MKSALPLAVAAALALSACKQEAPAPQASASAAASVAAAEVAGITASDGKLVLPAVKGRPGAAYFMLSNSDTKPATLSAVAIEGAGKTEMHETKGGAMEPLASAEIKPGDMVMFERGGKHVMVFDLAPTIAAGGTVKMTLTLDGGKTVELPLKVEAAGGGDMDHGAMH